MGLPVRRHQFDVQGFCAFLLANGCEVGIPTNQYEVVRYRAYSSGSKKPSTHIVYAKETGLLTWMPGTQSHYIAFVEGGHIAGNNPPFVSQFDKPAPAITTTEASQPSKGAKLRAKLIARDGDECWFCGEPMGDDCTIEHLIPKAKGGLNALANYAAAHQRCNAAAADLPLVAKVDMRNRLRAERNPA